MRIPGQLYFPIKWENVDQQLRMRFQIVQDLLSDTLQCAQPSYNQISKFAFSSTEEIVVRHAIAEVVKGRAKQSLWMTQEIAGFKKAARENLLPKSYTVYDAGLLVRRLFFEKNEPMRTTDLAIAWHTWMLISPPRQNDPVFARLSNFHAEPVLYSAVNIYLILLTAHPYMDGNGRTARIVFNLYLNRLGPTSQHYIPLADLTIATAGVYEECLGRACQHGDFGQMIAFLLSLLESYATLIKSLDAERPTSEVAEVLELIKQREAGTLGPGINNYPPYLLSISNLAQSSNEHAINREFIERLVGISQKLSEYGAIDFAITGLADIVDGLGPKSATISFFVKAYRKEELLLHFRELCAKHRGKVRLQIAVASSEPALDAKLLATAISQYNSCNSTETTCPILLYDFNPSCPQASCRSDVSEGISTRPKELT